MSFPFALSSSVLDACRRLTQQFRLLLIGQDALVDPAGDLAGVVVRKLSLVCELSTPRTFASEATRGANLHRGSQTLLHLSGLCWLQLHRLVYTLSVFQLLCLVSAGNLSVLLYMVSLSGALQIRVHAVEVDALPYVEVHFVLTGLTEIAL